MLVSYFLQKLGVLARITASWRQEAFPAPATSSILAIDGKPFPPLIEATLEDLVWGLDTGLFTSVNLVTSYTARILEVNSRLRVVNELNPDALDIAAELDAERALGSLRGPLHGIPILIKDNIATDDKSMRLAVLSYWVEVVPNLDPSGSEVISNLAWPRGPGVIKY